MVDISAISTTVVTVSVVVGVVFTLLEIRHLAKTRRTDVVMRIYERFGSREMIEAVQRVGAAKFETFDDYGKKYGWTDFLQVALFFEGVGALLEQDLIDISLVDSLFAPSFSSFWESTRPLIYGMRESANQPLLFSHFEDLYKRLSTYRKINTKA
jgi:hypothetical protein